MGSQISKEDEVHKILTLVFVINFPDQSNGKDLWNACKQYGYVVDAFIPNRRSKACKRFGFVRFIKVQRASLNNSSNQFRYNGEKRNNISDLNKDKGVKDTSNSYAYVVKGGLLSLFDGFNKLDFNIDVRVTWGELEDFVEQNEEENESDDEKFQGELKGDNLRSDEDLEGDNEKNAVPETVFEEDLPKSYGGEASVGQSYPPGFTPRADVEPDVERSKQRNGYVTEVGEEVKVYDDMKSGSERFFSKEDSTELVTNGKLLLIISVYAPQELTEKKLLWDYLFHVIANWKGANAFNSFISSAGLEEVPLGGLTTLDRYLSDHHPILLRESKYDYGPIPFRFFQYWLEVDGFEQLVKETWSEAPMDVSNAMLVLMKKLKYLKNKIRAWNNDMRKNSKNSKLKFKVELSYMDSIIDKGDSNDDIFNKRMEVVKSIQELDKLKSMEAAQKAKWSIEGDESSKYYHGILNKKRNQLSIRGVLVDGIRIDNPVLVKNEFLTHFKNRFERPQEARLNLSMDFPCKLTSIQQSDLEIVVSNEEIKKAVWDCGVDKSLGIAVDEDRVEQAALKIRCAILKSSLWARVIKAIHGDVEKIAQNSKSGNGTNTSFWEDVWLENVAFKYSYPRLYALESYKSIDVAAKLWHSSMAYSFHRTPRSGFSLVSMNDRWVWSLEGSGDFSVALIRKLIDDKRLPDVSSKTRWIKAVPIKVNVHAWNVRLDCLPTRINISRRGIDIDSILCPICGNAVESLRHLFFDCHVVKVIFRKISRWWDVSYMEMSSYEEWLAWILTPRLFVKHKRLLEGVCYGMWWHIWSFRNKCVFGSVIPSKASIFEDVVSRSFTGVVIDVMYILVGLIG
ncbi:RNA-directed DNA polymerase, eukaryota, reverse transcriptase zinc-binding domain protein [Tanacetum coccineum]